eukprot:TRINITY_DN33453_c0_g1_i2.p1 TRINITY_DN33453_c0_g1~~TRINITY_DN33453_c0_g1_i2.p1  ORF type:complete len:279 (+),score=22.95 TRINITY_DN33453_c0_g1_i2:83-919(+)
MGGLILHGAAAHVLETLIARGDEHAIALGHYISLSTPHLGIRASWWSSGHRWKNLSWLTSVVSSQLTELAVQDRYNDESRGQARPYLHVLAQPDNRFMQALGKFRTRTCVTLTSGDNLIPFASAFLDADCVHPEDGGPTGEQAEWSFADRYGMPQDSPFEQNWSRLVTRRMEDGKWVRQDANSVASRESELPFEDACSSDDGRDDGWRTSVDGTCCFQVCVLQGLRSVTWQRLPVQMVHPPSPMNAHVFLIGKACEQYEQEHRMSRDCVRCLLELLAV